MRNQPQSVATRSKGKMVFFANTDCAFWMHNL